MPDARELLRQGLVYQKGGAYDRAAGLYLEALSATADAVTAAEALRRLSHAQRLRCEWVAALYAARRSAEVAQKAGLADEYGQALNAEAAVHQSRGEYAQAETLYARVLEVSRSERTRGAALQNLAGVAARQGDMDAAESRLVEASSCYTRAGDSRGEASVLNNFTALALDRAEYALAVQRAQRAFEAARLVDDLELIGIARLNLAEALAALGKLDAAETEATAALGAFETTGNKWRRVEALRLLGRMKEWRQEPLVARKFYERALEAAEQIGAQADVAQLQQRLQELGGEADTSEEAK